MPTDTGSALMYLLLAGGLALAQLVLRGKQVDEREARQRLETRRAALEARS
jgi:hypothetical protein